MYDGKYVRFSRLPHKYIFLLHTVEKFEIFMCLEAWI